MVRRVSGLLDDRSQRPTLQIATVPWQRDPKLRLLRMLEHKVATADVMNEETLPLQHSQNVLRLECGKLPAHARSGTST